MPTLLLFCVGRIGGRKMWAWLIIAGKLLIFILLRGLLMLVMAFAFYCLSERPFISSKTQVFVNQ